MLVGDDGGRLHSVEVSDSRYIWILTTARRSWCRYETYSDRRWYTVDHCKLDSLQCHGHLYCWHILCQLELDLAGQCLERTVVIHSCWHSIKLYISHMSYVGISHVVIVGVCIVGVFYASQDFI